MLRARARAAAQGGGGGGAFCGNVSDNIPATVAKDFEHLAATSSTHIMRQESHAIKLQHCLHANSFYWQSGM